MKKMIVVKGKNVDVEALKCAIKSNPNVPVIFMDIGKSAIRKLALDNKMEPFRYTYFTRSRIPSSVTAEQRAQLESAKAERINKVMSQFNVVATVEPSTEKKVVVRKARRFTANTMLHYGHAWDNTQIDISYKELSHLPYHKMREACQAWEAYGDVDYEALQYVLKKNKICY